MKIIINIVLTIICLLYLSCDRKLTTNDILVNNKIQLPSVSILQIDSSLVVKYKNELKNAKSLEKNVLNTSLKLMERFREIPLDTTFIQTWNIDGLNSLDSIQTRVYFEQDTVKVVSKWNRNGEILWNYHYSNPYLYIKDSKLYDYDSRSKWITFSIGILFGAPDLQKWDNKPYVESYIIDEAVTLINNSGYKILKDDYLKYLKSFRGDYFSYGEPESRPILYIWFEPAKLFIPYYKE